MTLCHTCTHIQATSPNQKGKRLPLISQPSLIATPSLPIPESRFLPPLAASSCCPTGLSTTVQPWLPPRRPRHRPAPSPPPAAAALSRSPSAAPSSTTDTPACPATRAHATRTHRCPRPPRDPPSPTAA